MAGPELLTAVGAFAIGAAVTRLAARRRTARLLARLEAAEFETEQLRDERSETQPGRR